MLRTSGLFVALSPADLDKLIAGAELREAVKGELLARAGTSQHSILCMVVGKVSIYRRNKERGVTLLLGIVGGPAILGDMECAAGVSWMISIRAEEATTAIFVPNDAFLHAVRNNAALAFQLYQDASVRHCLANHTAQSIALYDTETRLLRLLLDYAGAFGSVHDDIATIHAPLTKVGMAAALGVTRKTIMRTLEPLLREGVVSRDPQDNQWRLHHVHDITQRLPKPFLGVTSTFGNRPDDLAQYGLEPEDD